MTEPLQPPGGPGIGMRAAPQSAQEVLRTGETARDVIDEIAAMLEQLPHTDIPVPRSEWTVGDHGAHLAFTNIGFGMFAMGLVYPYGDGTRTGLAEQNEMSLMGFSERGGPELAQHLVTAADNFLAQLDVRSPDQECFSPLGRMPLRTLTSYFLIHNLIHGCAISAGLNRPFPVKPEHIPSVWPVLVHAFPSFLNESAARAISGSIHLRIEGAPDRVAEMDGSQLTLLEKAGGPVDCEVDAEPIHFFLVATKLMTVEEAVELGKITVSGRDPALFARMMNALDVP